MKRKPLLLCLKRDATNLALSLEEIGLFKNNLLVTFQMVCFALKKVRNGGEAQTHKMVQSQLADKKKWLAVLLN
jgi:hypothetical protein